MGSSVKWCAKAVLEASNFPNIKWGLDWSEEKLSAIAHGDWEIGMNKNQVTKIEEVRDSGKFVVYSNCA